MLRIAAPNRVVGHKTMGAYFRYTLGGYLDMALSLLRTWALVSCDTHQLRPLPGPHGTYPCTPSFTYGVRLPLQLRLTTPPPGGCTATEGLTALLTGYNICRIFAYTYTVYAV